VNGAEIRHFLPLNPSAILVATVVAWLLKRNVMAAVAGAVTSILYSPLLPLIWLAEYRLGKLILPVQHPSAGSRRLRICPEQSSVLGGVAVFPGNRKINKKALTAQNGFARMVTL
jgi:uncharacterized protein (DUF2062 family)